METLFGLGREWQKNSWQNSEGPWFFLFFLMWGGGGGVGEIMQVGR